MKSLAVANKVERVDTFHAETALPAEERAELSDYAKSGYDRGHLAPAADMPTETAQQESFSLANMTPQAPGNNRGIWSEMEGVVRKMVQKRGELYVVSGPLFQGKTIKRLNGRVFVPTDYFKAVYDPKTQDAGSYLVANEKTKDYKVISIEELTQLTGIDPFPSIAETSRRQAMELPPP